MNPWPGGSQRPNRGRSSRAQWQGRPSATGGWHRGTGIWAPCCWQSPRGACTWCSLGSLLLLALCSSSCIQGRQGQTALPLGSGQQRLPDQSWLEKHILQPDVLAATHGLSLATPDPYNDAAHLVQPWLCAVCLSGGTGPVPW